MKIICIICARKSSKGIKNKNIKSFFGKPLILHTINQAKKLKIFDKIICSSDSKYIRLIANKAGVDLTINRPAKLANDISPKIETIKHSLIFSESHFNSKFDLIVDLDITTPLRSLDDIKQSIKLIKSKKLASNLITITPSKKNPYFNMVEIDKEGKVQKSKKSNLKITSRQMAPKVYDINAGIYVWNRQSLLKNKDVINKNTLFYITPYERSIDIDTNTDFELVKFFYKQKKLN